MVKERREVTVLFDSKLRSRSGKTIPYYDTCWYEDSKNEFKDQSEHWFHEGYGLFRKYRLHQIDDTDTFIAEDLHEIKEK